MGRLRDGRRREVTQTVTTVAHLREYVRRQKHDRKTIGLVPTMGALHEGHLSLVRRAASENARTIVSIFVNPIQFGPHEDLQKYPRDLARDTELSRSAGADVVFAPTAEEVYPEGFSTFVEVEKVTAGLCGASRPGHFRGVATVCAKLFAMAEPDRVYFGEKDYQQLVVIRRMVADLNMPIEVVACPTVREPDGLALSSRNAYLDADMRRHALVLYRSLVEAKRVVEEAHVTRASEITAAMRKVIQTAPAKIDYIAVVHPETLEPLDAVTGEAVVALAVFINKIRLIDNIRVQPKGAT